MSAVEALAEVLEALLTISPMECVYREETTHWHGPLEEGDDEDDVVRDFTFATVINNPRGQEAERIASALVAAIRSMPAEQVAELIGGEVERAEVDAKWGSPYLGLADGTPLRRVVTHWLPLGVSPETNGEQK